MKTMVIQSVLFASAFLLCFGVESAVGQIQSGSQSKPSAQPMVKTQPKKQLQTQTQQVMGTKNKMAGQTGLKKTPVIEPNRPWKLTSRIHLEKGSNRGYLVVQLDLADGYHVYSLNAEGSPSPTRLAVLPSNDLLVQSKFASDKAPMVIEKDPVFGQRIEKHKGQVQFFASIVVRPGVDLKKLSQEVQFSGQICSENACQPIRKQTATAQFSGFFEVPKTRNAAKDPKLK